MNVYVDEVVNTYNQRRKELEEKQAKEAKESKLNRIRKQKNAKKKSMKKLSKTQMDKYFKDSNELSNYTCKKHGIIESKHTIHRNNDLDDAISNFIKNKHQIKRSKKRNRNN